MDAQQERQARELADQLAKAGPRCGLLMNRAAAVVMRCQGTPFTDTPMLLFGEADLQNAVELGLLKLEKRTSTAVTSEGTERSEWEWYVTRK